MEQLAVDESTCLRLQQMVDLHVGLHGDDASKSLETVGSASGIVHSLRQLEDDDV